MTDRRAELAHNLASVRQRIAAAATEAGRAPEDVTMVVVTKTYPASDVAHLAALGVTDVGENRHPEAARKREEAGEAGAGLRWHFVGGLQTNKAGAVARYADVVHSVDRPRLVDALARGAALAGREVEVLIQVNLEGRDDDPVGRAGADPADILALAGRIDAADGLVLGGVMAVAPLGADPDPAFARLSEISASVAASYPGATTISAGMSGDLESAVRHGATHVRIGRSVLGERPALG
ncbi:MULTISPECIES: YggS family pyridoxal phosphate-dependent enzyme [Mumia]|uniref:YggS family pyridoxal phosphate-dependent enzyme n=1 Tax=Mumia TaxID=1546255 RepID=UPI00142398D6|nr:MULTISPECIES: YggS family pyridoxal phosphate-dependent enzyme [unclassified Mumia]QMW67772.1 YggS family pyridoxal phosphate-dependent enzyme [Mumia sp. ZJ1417]